LGANEEELLARELEEQLKRIRVEDVLVQTLVTVSSIGYRCLGLTDDTKDARDLQQTARAIAVMQALTPVLATILPAEAVRDFESSVANLQLAYASAAATVAPKREDQPEEQREEPETEATPDGDGQEEKAEEEERPRDEEKAEDEPAS
jgi:hypothetical protein